MSNPRCPGFVLLEKALRLDTAMSVSVVMVKSELPNLSCCCWSIWQKSTKARRFLLMMGKWILNQFKVQNIYQFKVFFFFFKEIIRNDEFQFLKSRAYEFGYFFPMKSKKYNGLLQQPKGNCALMNWEVCNKLREANNTADCNLCSQTWQKVFLTP